MDKIKRIDNVELRKTTHILTDEPYFEIVLYYKNPRYGQEGEIPELCYTLSIIENLREDEEHDIRSTGSRPFFLDRLDRDAYDRIVAYTYTEECRLLMLSTIA